MSDTEDDANLRFEGVYPNLHLSLGESISHDSSLEYSQYVPGESFSNNISQSNNNQDPQNNSLIMSPSLLSRSVKRQMPELDDINIRTPRRLKQSHSLQSMKETQCSYSRQSSFSTTISSRRSSIFEEDLLNLQLKRIVQCSSCERLGGQSFQDENFNLFCIHCVSKDSNFSLTNSPDTPYSRNIAIEKVINEILEPAVQRTPPKYKRVRRITDETSQSPTKTTKSDMDVNNNSSTSVSLHPQQNTMRKRSYTLPQNILSAIETYEQHKSELGPRVQRWLQCSVCLETARPLVLEEKTPELAHEFKRLNPVLQCSNGHLICDTCLARLLADSALKNGETACPFCRVKITAANTIRNKPVEDILTLLPMECETCFEKLPINEVVDHERTECPDKSTKCSFSILGCVWKGPNKELSRHEVHCIYYNQSAKNIQTEIRKYSLCRYSTFASSEEILRLFSQRLAFVDFQLNSSRTDEYIPRLYFKSGNISALGYTFAVKIWVCGIDPLYPTKSQNRSLQYQIFLRGYNSKTTMDAKEKLNLSHILLTPPPGRYTIKRTVYADKLTTTRREGMKWNMCMGSNEINMILSKPSITLRLFLFLP